MTQELGLSEYDSKIITGSKNLSDIFDGTMKYFDNPKEVVNWIIVELLSIAKGDNKGEDDVKIDCRKFAEIMELVDNKTINRNIAKKLLLLIWEDDIDPVLYVKENKLGMVSDTRLIEDTIQLVLKEQSNSVEQYKAGNDKLFNFLVGQVMKKLAGKADPKIVNSL